MTDRELLEAAAKAAGMEFRWEAMRQSAGSRSGGFARARQPQSGDAFPIWNPLTDDGDALRLAVNLGLFTHCENDMRRTQCGMGPLPGLKSVEHGADPYAATRRAIVRAAASIGAK